MCVIRRRCRALSEQLPALFRLIFQAAALGGHAQATAWQESCALTEESPGMKAAVAVAVRLVAAYSEVRQLDTLVTEFVSSAAASATQATTAAGGQRSSVSAPPDISGADAGAAAPDAAVSPAARLVAQPQLLTCLRQAVGVIPQGGPLTTDVVGVSCGDSAAPPAAPRERAGACAGSSHLCDDCTMIVVLASVGEGAWLC